MANLSSLPCDLLSEIVLKLDAVEDFVYFSVVSHSFRDACSMVKHKWRPRMPCLLLPENTNNNPDCHRKFFSLSAKRCYQLKLPQTFGARCWGSSCGFVVRFDINLQLHLFNPLTQDQILLPPQPTMPNQYPQDDEDDDDIAEIYPDLLHDHVGFVSKVIVFEEGEGNYLVLAICGRDDMRALAFARPGDKEWTAVLTTRKYKWVYDVCCYGRRIYILYADGNLEYFDISEVHSSQPLTAQEYVNLHPPRAIEELGVFVRGYRPGSAGLYLMESLGHLLMVLRGFRKGHSHFEVYRLNFGLKEWEQIHDLGDVALFVGDNRSISVQASVVGNFKRNCIYFTHDDFTMEVWNCPDQDQYDMCIFDMESKKIEAFYYGEHIEWQHCPPFWFTPRF